MVTLAKYCGIAVSRGIATGKVMHYQAYAPQIGKKDYGGDAPARERKYREVIAQAQAELDAVIARLGEQDAERRDIMAAQKALLTDAVLEEEILLELEERQPDVAIDAIYGKYAEIMREVPDAIIRERAADFIDLKSRLLRICEGGRGIDLSTLTEDCIVVAGDILPSDVVALDREHVLGIVTEVGGATSHAAIIARSYGIPAVFGVQGAAQALHGARLAIVDAADLREGVVIAEPDEVTLAQYREKERRHREDALLTRQYLQREPVTLDGERIEVMLNISAPQGADLDHSPHVAGVGLFRTEFMYMQSASAPTEEEQYESYCRVLRHFAPRPVVLRTMDIGGDKNLPYLELPHEDNPFLGNRALRLNFTMPGLLRTQLRAALRASAAGNLWLMFPMVTNMEDVHAIKANLRAVEEELRQEGCAPGEYKTGIMIEVPGIAMMSAHVAAEVDFASVGTNDLCQYLLAADRMNPAVSRYYQCYHPAMLGLLQGIAEAFGAAGKPVGICGEMAGDARATEMLLGMGYRELSMSGEAVPAVKQRICGTNLAQARNLAQQALAMKTEEEILNLLAGGATPLAKEEVV